MEHEVWRLVDSGAGSPAWNMAVDEAILHIHSQGKTPPTIRFYSWNPATLSIGYFQKIEEEVVQEAIDSYGLGLVRRITGGRAVLHDQELTYSMVISESHPLMPQSVIDAYKVISTGLHQGFKNLGLDSSFAIPTPIQQNELKHPRSSVCFDNPSWYELVVEGRKAAGSAQTRQKGVILQHGSILLDVNRDMLIEVCRFPNEETRAKLKAEFDQKVVAINQLLLNPVTLEQVKIAFKCGFEKGLGIQLQEGSLTSEEQQLAEELVRKYNSDEWNLKR